MFQGQIRVIINYSNMFNDIMHKHFLFATYLARNVSSRSDGQSQSFTPSLETVITDNNEMTIGCKCVVCRQKEKILQHIYNSILRIESSILILIHTGERSQRPVAAGSICPAETCSLHTKSCRRRSASFSERWKQKINALPARSVGKYRELLF